jgi:hypothetical protein
MKKQQTYSNELFDITQRMALFLAYCARKGGREIPTNGYSQEDWQAAEMMLRSGITTIAGMDGNWG